MLRSDTTWEVFRACLGNVCWLLAALLVAGSSAHGQEIVSVTLTAAESYDPYTFRVSLTTVNDEGPFGDIVFVDHTDGVTLETVAVGDFSRGNGGPGAGGSGDATLSADSFLAWGSTRWWRTLFRGRK